MTDTLEDRLKMTMAAVADATSIPEPSTLILAGIAGLMGLGFAWRRRCMAVAV